MTTIPISNKNKYFINNSIGSGRKRKNIISKNYPKKRKIIELNKGQMNRSFREVYEFAVVFSIIFIIYFLNVIAYTGIFSRLT